MKTNKARFSTYISEGNIKLESQKHQLEEATRKIEKYNELDDFE